jgi:hypothetical protein
MAALATLGDFLQSATVDVLPPNAERKFAAFARKCLAQSIASGFGTQQYDKYVNGRFNVSEESVKLPGSITYIFHSWANVIPAALADLRRRVPRGKTGKYQNSFLVVVDGRVVTNFAKIPVGAEVAILNAQPYTRKMEVGANKTGARHFDGARRTINSKFSGAFEAETAYLNVTSGLDPRVPYILKRSNGRRKDSQAGSAITYPSLILKAL